jgi:Carboxypeptidase regulatory-like domain
MKKLIILIILTILISCATKSDDVYLDSQLKDAMLIGKVITEEGLPLESVTVKLNKNSETKTDISGRFFFKFIAYGKYNITFEKEGYLPAEYSFEYTFKTRKNKPVIKAKMLSTNYLVNEAFELLKEKKFKEVSDVMQNLEKINPDEDTVLYLKAMYHYMNAQFNEALPLLEKLKLRDRKNVYYQLTLIDIYEKLGMYEKEADLAYYLGNSNPKEYINYLKTAAELYKNKLNKDKEYEKAMNDYNKYLSRYGEKKK